MAVFKRWKGVRINSRHPKYKEARWWMHKRIHGRTVHRSLGEAQTKEQAEAIERQILSELTDKKWGFSDRSTTFKEFVERTYVSYVHQKNTNIYVKELFIKELNSYFGKMILSEITEDDCLQYRYKRLKTPLRYGGQRSNASVNKEMSTLSKIFTLAKRSKVIRDHPMEFVEKLEEAPSRKHKLSREQVSELLRVAEQDEVIRGMVLLALHLPIRKAQILAIRPEHVDGDVLWVIASKRKPPKEVPLSEAAKRILADLTEKGVIPFKIQYTQKRWQEALRAAGIPHESGKRSENFHFHDLRRVLGSELAKVATPFEIQSLFGHSDIKTSTIYINTEKDQLVEALNQVKWVH